jgi:putative flippase GtrA
VGGVNTVFGYSTFALLTAGFDRITPSGYIIAGMLASVVNITFSFLTYKRFVFKTKGNYFREWLRCVAVNSGGNALNTVLLPVFVFAIRPWTVFTAGAPYIAGALLIGLSAVWSLGHRNYSFRPVTVRLER